MRTSLLAALALCLAASGCFLRRSAADLSEFEQRVTLRGTVAPLSQDGTPIVLTLLAKDPETDRFKAHSHQVRYSKGPFEFLCPAGEYFLIAYEDRNQDMTFQQAENVGWPSREPLKAKAGDVHEKLDVQLRDPAQARQQIPELYERAEPFPAVDLEKGKLGVLTTLDDPRFSQETGTLGMWEPVRYCKEGNNGIYFLEPYAADKIPVVFVHGIKGCGSQFRTLIEKLDRKRYQPWIAQYASGLRLGLIAERMAQALVQLRLKHDCERMHVVAHSMGGLVSRGALNALQRDGHDFVDLFVSYSTPFGGHAAARSGVEWSPVVLPVWYDMVPESPFIGTLFETPLRDGLPHWLAFSFHGDPSMFVDEQNDGVVTIKSQLHPPAQRGAVRIAGYDEDHATILTCDASQAFLQQAFASVDDR